MASNPEIQPKNIDQFSPGLLSISEIEGLKAGMQNNVSKKEREQCRVKFIHAVIGRIDDAIVKIRSEKGSKDLHLIQTLMEAESGLETILGNSTTISEKSKEEIETIN
jgi:hypothetical protein